MGFKLRDLNIQVECRICKEDHFILVNKDDFISWKGGTLIQRAFPYLTPAQRELLISKTCEPCFDKLFGDNDGS